jgi:hypothetical protein
MRCFFKQKLLFITNKSCNSAQFLKFVKLNLKNLYIFCNFTNLIQLIKHEAAKDY